GAGRISLDGEDVTRRSTLERRIAGIRVIPFERNVEGVSATSSLWENFAILAAQAGGGRLLSPRRMRERCRAALDAWQVRYRSVNDPVSSLSGGNVQRLILARELSEGVELVLAAQPTRGLDVAATEFVRASLAELARRGSGVLLVSSDLEELFAMSDRVVVMLGGRIVAEFARPFDRAEVGAAMTGARA